MTNKLSWAEFENVEMRVGTIVDAHDFPQARNPSYQLIIDFGADLGQKKTSAQITKLYSREELIGKQIVAVVNFPKKQIANMMSECLVLGAVDGQEVVLLNPDRKVKNGLRIS